MPYMTPFDTWRPVTVNYIGLDPSDAVTTKAMDNVQRLQNTTPTCARARFGCSWTTSTSTRAGLSP